jgi:hypothetical protein
LLEQAQQYAKDTKATDELMPSRARALFAQGLEGEEFDPESLLDYSVRGPFLVGSHIDNGRKLVVEHDLNVDYVPATGERGRAQMSDEEYQREIERRRLEAEAAETGGETRL